MQTELILLNILKDKTYVSALVKCTQFCWFGSELETFHFYHVYLWDHIKCLEKCGAFLIVQKIILFYFICKIVILTYYKIHRQSVTALTKKPVLSHRQPISLTITTHNQKDWYCCCLNCWLLDSEVLQPGGLSSQTNEMIDKVFYSSSIMWWCGANIARLGGVKTIYCLIISFNP